MAKEDLKNLEKMELVLPAKDLFNAVTVSADALTTQPITPERAKVLKLVLGFLNSYIRAFGTKARYFKLIGVNDKIKAVHKFSKRLY